MENKEKNNTYQILKAICKLLLKILYRPQIYGVENIPKDGAIIFAGNHVHAFDPVVVAVATDRIVHYIAKEELFKGLHGALLRKMEIISVDRSKRNPGAVLKAEKILNSGGTIGIFPEGTRNRTEEELLRFKNGAVKMAQNSNCKIVPFAIKGEYKVFRKKLMIEFGEPIEVANLEVQEATDYLRNEVLQLLRKK